MGAALWTWSGAPLFLGLPAVVVCLWLLPPRPSQAAEAAVRALTRAYVIAATIALPYGILSALRGRDPLGFYYVSLLHPALCLLLGLGVTLFAWVIAPLRQGELRHSSLRAALAVGLAATPLLLPPVRRNLLGGLDFVGRSDAGSFVGQIGESAPLLASEVTRGFALQHVGLGHYLLGLLLFAPLSPALRGRRAGALTFWVYGVMVLGLALIQVRFLVYLGPLVAALPVAYRHWLSSRGARVANAAAVLVACGIAYAPLSYWAQALLPGARVPLVQTDAATLTLLERLRRETPQAGDASDPLARPDYCVFAPWSLGHEILVLGRRAVVANNFGLYMEGGSYRDQARFYEEVSEPDAALAIIDRRGCRYVLTEGGSGGPARFANRLHFANDSDLPAGRGSGRLRLAMVQPRAAGVDAPAYKLFERVEGAEVEIGGAPDGELLLVLSTRVDGTPQRFGRRVTVGAGRAHARVAQEGAYRVLHRGVQVARVELTEAQVREGARVRVDAVSP